MGKLRCPCGHTISSVAYPNDAIGNVVTQCEYDAVLSLDQDGIRDLLHDGREIWECSECGRLSFSYPGRSDSTVKWYVPEDGKPGHLLRRENWTE